MPSLHFSHQITANFLWPTLSEKGNKLTTPSSLLSLSINLPLWACVVGFSPLFITAALKATFLPPTTAATLCRGGQHSQLCKGVSPWEYSKPHHSLSEALHQPCHPMSQGFPGAPRSSRPGCWLFWHAALLVEGSPALLTPLSGFPSTSCFWSGKQELSPFSFLSLCGCM